MPLRTEVPESHRLPSKRFCWRLRVNDPFFPHLGCLRSSCFALDALLKTWSTRPLATCEFAGQWPALLTRGPNRTLRGFFLKGSYWWGHLCLCIQSLCMNAVHLPDVSPKCWAISLKPLNSQLSQFARFTLLFTSVTYWFLTQSWDQMSQREEKDFLRLSKCILVNPFIVCLHLSCPLASTKCLIYHLWMN